MPIKKTITEVVEGPEDEQEIIVTEDDLAEEAEETALDGLLAEFQGADNVSVNVYRQGDGKNMSFLFKTTPEEMTGGDIMERCRDKFGTGDYRMHVRQGRRIVANKPFSVEAPKEPAEIVTPQNNNSDIIALIQSQNTQMATLFQSTMAAMAEAIKGSHSQQPAVDPVAMQASVIQGLAAMKEIAGGDKSEPGAVEMLIKGLELAKELAPKTGDTNTMDILSKGLDMMPMLAKAGEINKPTQGHHNPPVGIPPHKPVEALKGPPPAANPVPEVSPEEEQKRKESEMFFAQAKANLRFLCKQAQENRDPGLYAEVVLDQMGEEQVLEFIGKEDALETLAKIEPGVAIYQGWFIALRNAILELTSESNKEPDEPVPNDDPEHTDFATVVARINDSGLRREGQDNAPVLIPGEEDVILSATGDPAPDPNRGKRGGSESTRDT